MAGEHCSEWCPEELARGAAKQGRGREQLTDCGGEGDARNQQNVLPRI